MEKDVIITEVGHENPGFLQVSLRGDAQINERTGDRSQVERSQSSATTSGKYNPAVDNEADDKVDLSCGIWRFRTNIFGRKFSNLYVFITCVGLSTFFTTVIHTTFQIQLTSMQRHFGINNLQTGMFETASRIGSLSTILFAGHFAKKTHIPVVVGLAGLIQGTIFMVPAFIQIFDPYILPVMYLLAGTDLASGATIQFTILLTVYFFKKEEREEKAKLQEERIQKEEPVITTQL